MTRARGRDADMTQGNILRQYIDFALPLTVGLLFQQLYGFVVDVVGRLIQQQHIAGLDECRSDTGSPAFSAGERSDVP